jgi:hypothetical protein
MKELGAESAAIQLDAERRAPSIVLLGRTQIALKQASKTFGPHGIFIRGRYLKDMIADGAFK